MAKTTWKQINKILASEPRVFGRTEEERLNKVTKIVLGITTTPKKPKKKKHRRKYQTHEITGYDKWGRVSSRRYNKKLSVKDKEDLTASGYRVRRITK